MNNFIFRQARVAMLPGSKPVVMVAVVDVLSGDPMIFLWRGSDDTVSTYTVDDVYNYEVQ